MFYFIIQTLKLSTLQTVTVLLKIEIEIVSINGENYGATHVVFGQVIATHVPTDLKVDGEKVNEQAVH